PPAPAGSLPAAGPRAVAGTAPGQVGTGGTAAGEAAPVVAVLAVEQPVPDPLAEGLPAGGLPAERAELRPPVPHRRVGAPSRCAPRRVGRAASAARPAHAASAAGDAARCRRSATATRSGCSSPTATNHPPTGTAS